MKTTRRHVLGLLAGAAIVVGVPSFWMYRMKTCAGPVSDHFDGTHFFDPDGSLWVATLGGGSALDGGTREGMRREAEEGGPLKVKRPLRTCVGGCSWADRGSWPNRAYWLRYVNLPSLIIPITLAR